MNVQELIERLQDLNSPELEVEVLDAPGSRILVGNVYHDAYSNRIYLDCICVEEDEECLFDPDGDELFLEEVINNERRAAKG